jgi:hypothetical protein
VAWFIFLLGRFKLIQYRPPQISMGSSPWSRKFNKENVKNSFSSSYGNTVVNGMNCHCILNLNHKIFLKTDPGAKISVNLNLQIMPVFLDIFSIAIYVNLKPIDFWFFHLWRFESTYITMTIHAIYRNFGSRVSF